MLAPCPSDHFDIFWSFTYFTKFIGLKKQLQDPKMDQSISTVVHGATHGTRYDQGNPNFGRPVATPQSLGPGFWEPQGEASDWFLFKDTIT